MYSLCSLTGRAKRKSSKKVESKADEKSGDELDSSTNYEAGDKANGSASGTEYDETYSDAETETDSRLESQVQGDGRAKYKATGEPGKSMMHNKMHNIRMFSWIQDRCKSPIFPGSRIAASLPYFLDPGSLQVSHISWRQ